MSSNTSPLRSSASVIVSDSADSEEQPSKPCFTKKQRVEGVERLFPTIACVTPPLETVNPRDFSLRNQSVGMIRPGSSSSLIAASFQSRLLKNNKASLKEALLAANNEITRAVNDLASGLFGFSGKEQIQVLRAEIKKETGDLLGALEDLRTILLSDPRNSSAVLIKRQISRQLDKKRGILANLLIVSRGSVTETVLSSALVLFDSQERADEEIHVAIISNDIKGGKNLEALIQIEASLALCEENHSSLLSRAEASLELESDENYSAYMEASDLFLNQKHVLLALKAKVNQNLGATRAAIDNMKYSENILETLSESSHSRSTRSILNSVKVKIALPSIRAFWAQGKFEVALELTKTVLALDPKNIDLMVFSLSAKIKLRRDLEALGDINSYLNRNPSSIAILYARSVIEERQGNLSQAFQDVSKVLELYPNWRDAKSLSERVSKKLEEGNAVHLVEEIPDDGLDRLMGSLNLGSPSDFSEISLEELMGSLNLNTDKKSGEKRKSSNA
ncbi:hypothetical protein AB751O23_AB_00020 [Chlamydiales bacterium SCGC AB-751-O23]|jgi:tetratricopeptide (TPR) repeat protein|nr:hypothetical protein AB751O23_AB_00020 [Chlamydiales bacterium SCGC AB-751-O23]